MQLFSGITTEQIAQLVPLVLWLLTEALGYIRRQIEQRRDELATPHPQMTPVEIFYRLPCELQAVILVSLVRDLAQSLAKMEKELGNANHS